MGTIFPLCAHRRWARSSIAAPIPWGVYNRPPSDFSIMIFFSFLVFMGVAPISFLLPLYAAGVHLLCRKKIGAFAPTLLLFTFALLYLSDIINLFQLLLCVRMPLGLVLALGLPLLLLNFSTLYFDPALSL